MEFRYRAIDGDRPPTATTDTTPTQSLNHPSYSFLSARPIPGCNIIGPNKDHHLEAIQREIEKEQIRHEIIVAETARRRELIAEVVQDMAIEREMAIRRVAEDKLTMLTNQKKMLPNQNQDNNINNNLFRYVDPMMYTSPYRLVTSPMMQLSPIMQIPEATPVLESNIVLNRPGLVGSKRKSEDTQTGLEGAKRKADNACLVRDPHLLGPENQEKKTASSKIPPLLEKIDSGKQIESKKKHKFKFWCDICGVGAFSQTVMRNHELGKKHMATIKQQNEKPETASPSFIIIPTPSQSEANVQDHQKVAAKESGEKKKKKKVTLWCEICNIRTYSEQVMETHRLGKKHKAMLEKQQNNPLAVLDTNLSTFSGEKGSN